MIFKVIKMLPRRTGTVNFVVVLVLALATSVSWAKRQDVEEVTKRQLDSLLKSEDYLAVFWCKSKFKKNPGIFELSSSFLRVFF